MRPSDYLRKGWCRGVSARYVNGKECGPRNPDAASWCMLGAVTAAYRRHHPKCVELLSAIEKRTGRSIADFNDHSDRTQQECIDLMLAAENEVLGGE